MTNLDREPVYRTIADDIVRRVAMGELVPGARLAPVREAAAHWGVNLNTVAPTWPPRASSRPTPAAAPASPPRPLTASPPPAPPACAPS